MNGHVELGVQTPIKPRGTDIFSPGHSPWGRTCRPVFVRRCQAELLHLPPRILSHMVEAALDVDVAVDDCSDGIDRGLFKVAGDRRRVYIRCTT